MMRPYLKVLVVVILFGASTNGLGSTLGEENALNGWIRYNQNDYAGAVSFWTKAAQEGDVRSMFGLGELYRTGKGVKRDPQIAVKLYTDAANRGSPEAQHNLASMFFDGDGTRKDVVSARALYMKAANQGYIPSERQLGFIFYNEKNYVQAVNWWSRASEVGDAESQYRMALMYVLGQGVSQNDRVALTLMKLAADKGHPDATKYYNRFLEINKPH